MFCKTENAALCEKGTDTDRIAESHYIQSLVTQSAAFTNLIRKMKVTASSSLLPFDVPVLWEQIHIK